MKVRLISKHIDSSIGPNRDSLIGVPEADVHTKMEQRVQVGCAFSFIVEPGRWSWGSEDEARLLVEEMEKGFRDLVKRIERKYAQ